MFSVLLVAEVLQGIGPKKVAHGPKCGGLFEAVKLKHNEDDIQSYSSGLSQCFVTFFKASCESLPGQ